MAGDTTADRIGTLVERHFWAIVVAIMIIGLVFRLPGIGSRSLWIDELYSEWFSSRSFAELWRDVPSYETHPPAYYTLLKLWRLVFGDSELGLRSLSLVASLATILVVAASGRLLDAGRVGIGAGLLGAALLAVNYASIREAQNARPYAIQALLCAIAITAALMLVTRPARGSGSPEAAKGWLWPMLVLGVSAGLGLWIHNTGFFIALGLWFGLALTLVFTPAGQRLRNFAIFLAAGLLALLVWAPYLPIFIAQSRAFGDLAFWLQPKFRDLYSAWFFLLGESWPALCLAMVLLAIGLYRLGRCSLVMALPVAAILVLPLYSVLAISFAIKPVYIQRLFAWMVPLGLVLVALGILAATRQTWPRLVLAVIVFAFAVTRTVADYGRPIDDWKSIVSEIADNARPGDVVIAVPAEGSIAVDYYAKRQPHFPPVICVPGCYPQRNLPRTYMSNFGAPRLIEADGEIVDRALATHGRVWLVQVSTTLYDPKSIVRKRIAANRTFVRYHGNAFAKVELFE